MADPDRLDELERKFAENPRRYFAPLANEYRKSGDLATAIRICREQLASYPGHMSGHVVLGQALYESRQPEDARRSFERALELDPENLIALRHLGDIARDRGDGTAARAWYQRVLEADPRNDDIAAQLQQLTPAAQRVAPPAAPPATESYVAPPPPPAPVLEPLEWSALDLALPGEDATVAAPHETAELPVPAPVEEAPAPEPTRFSGPLDLDDELFELPPAAPAAEEAAAPDAAEPTIVEPTGVEPVTHALPEPVTALDPVDWAELLPDELEAEVAPAASVVETPSEPEPHPAPEVEPEPEPEAEPELEPVVEPVAEAPAEAEPEAVVSTIEEVWVPAAASAVVEVEEFAEPAPAADEPVAEAPRAMEPGAMEPGAMEPGAEEPLAAEPAGEPEPATEPEAEIEPEPASPALEFVHDWAEAPADEAAVASAVEAPEAVTGEAGWIDALPEDVSPELLDVVEPALEAEVESPLAEDAWAESPEPTVEAVAVEPSSAPEPAAEPAAEPEPAYDPIVGLDLPPIATDEPEPYPAAHERPTPAVSIPAVPFVTETMAGLLLSQGHLDQALDVYEQLAAQRPDDAGLAARVADLRASQQPPRDAVSVEPPAGAPIGGGATAGAFFAALVGGGAGAAPGAPAGDAPSVEAPVVEAPVVEAPVVGHAVVPTTARGLLAGEVDADDERAARRLADAFSSSASPATSLADALFVSPPSLPAAATPPAPPAPAEEAPYGLGDFSFERFFEGLEEGAPAEGAPADGAAPASDAGASAEARAEPARPATPVAPMPAVEEPAAPARTTTDDEDLAQFHAWLKGLQV